MKSGSASTKIRARGSPMPPAGRSRLTCVLSILASREPSTATTLSAMFPEAAIQPSRSLLWHTKTI